MFSERQIDLPWYNIIIMNRSCGTDTLCYDVTFEVYSFGSKLSLDSVEDSARAIDYWIILISTHVFMRLSSLFGSPPY